MHYPILFEIPVYYRTPEKSLADREQAEEGIKQSTKDGWKSLGPLSTEAERRMDRAIQDELDRFERDEWPYWKYNEIIAWFSVNIGPMQIRAELSTWEHKRYDRRSRKVYRFIDGGAISMNIFPDADYSRLHEKLIDQIRSCVKRAFGKKAWADVSTLENLGPYIDWDALIASVRDEH